MSNSPDHNGQDRPDDSWQDRLRAILGPEAAEQIIEQMKRQGYDADDVMAQMMNPANLALVTHQIQQMLGSSGEGPVNWELAERVARETITAKHVDRLTAQSADEARNSLRTASLWLDAATSFDPTTGPNMALSRLDLLAHSLATFRKLLEPVGANVSRAFVDTFAAQAEHLPSQMAGLLGNPTAFIGKMISSVLGVQYGGALAELAVESFGSADTGVPLMEGSSAVLAPSNISALSKDLEIPDTEVLLYVAVREAAAARLYTRVPWLRPRVIDTIAQIASGFEIDMESIEEQARGITGGMSFDPTSMPEIDMTKIFVLELSDEQEDSVARLQLLLSLIEGWVSEVTARAVAPHLPNAVALRELFARRYATDNPAKHVWEAQLGIELAPRLQREAAMFWRLAEQCKGIEARDAMWAHPDLLPDAEDLTNPEAFFGSTVENVEAELDSFLENLFNDADQGQAPHEPGFGGDRLD
ncbi:zinc-dependent metalloprotease [Trueperella pyogenes]|uniref:zinc-dependent metalloprotease n=1 Tax=Trueperella pyogenes TaxID=1661 RepID=UPI00345CA4F0